MGQHAVFTLSLWKSTLPPPPPTLPTGYSIFPLQSIFFIHQWCTYLRWSWNVDINAFLKCKKRLIFDENMFRFVPQALLQQIWQTSNVYRHLQQSLYTLSVLLVRQDNLDNIHRHQHKLTKSTYICKIWQTLMSVWSVNKNDRQSCVCGFWHPLWLWRNTQTYLLTILLLQQYI